jgi:hypothetical protein
MRGGSSRSCKFPDDDFGGVDSGMPTFANG